MIKRERFSASINGVADELELLYELYPEYRGVSPGSLFNIAVKEWLNSKINKGAPANHNTMRREYSAILELSLINGGGQLGKAF